MEFCIAVFGVTSAFGGKEWRIAGALELFALFAAFAAGQLAIAARGARSTCGCLGGRHMIGPVTILRAGGFALAALVAALVA